ncbi:MAG: rRNA adenine dimethyltransferase family protein [Bacteroidota bacterium]
MSVRPKKGLGQHFLAEPSVVRRIVDAVQAPPEARVVEIGPGEGAMTGALLARYPDLIALEIDAEAIAHLRRRFPTLDVREGDVLEANWRALAGEERGKGEGERAASGVRSSTTPPTRSPLPPGGGQGEGRPGTPEASGDSLHSAEAKPPPPAGAGTSPRGGGEIEPPEALGVRGEDPASRIPHPASLFVAGNLPYYISSPILFALLDAREHIARADVMVQKEVADRIVSPPGSKTYGTLSVYFSLFARAELLFDVPPEAFRPPPKVDSAVVALDFSPEAGSPAEGLDSAALRRVVRAAFGQRRKMLRNSLKGLAAETGREVPDWAATLRPEQVAPADFVRLTHAFFSP